MKVGRVVSIRVNPTDCLSVIDVVQKIGLNIRGISFSQVVSIALSSALEAMRQNGVVPDRDGSEYLQMMAQFPTPLKSQRGRSLDITKTLYLAGSDARVPPVVVDAKRKQALRRYEELALKLEAAPESLDAEQQRELRELTAVLFPDPDLVNNEEATREPID